MTQAKEGFPPDELGNGSGQGAHQLVVGDGTGGEFLDLLSGFFSLFRRIRVYPMDEVLIAFCHEVAKGWVTAQDMLFEGSAGLEQRVGFLRIPMRDGCALSDSIMHLDVGHESHTRTLGDGPGEEFTILVDSEAFDPRANLFEQGTVAEPGSRHHHRSGHQPLTRSGHLGEGAPVLTSFDIVGGFPEFEPGTGRQSLWVLDEPVQLGLQLSLAKKVIGIEPLDPLKPRVLEGDIPSVTCAPVLGLNEGHIQIGVTVFPCGDHGARVIRRPIVDHHDFTHKVSLSKAAVEGVRDEFRGIVRRYEHGDLVHLAFSKMVAQLQPSSCLTALAADQCPLRTCTRMVRAS